MIKVEKMILHRDFPDSYVEEEFSFNEQFHQEYLAGDLAPIVEKNKHKLVRRDVINKSLFNKSNNARLVIQVGPRGYYYLLMRPNVWLDKISMQPENLVADIFYSENNRLLYGFYNPTKEDNIVIVAHYGPDTEGVYSKIKTESEDIILRKYFIRRAIISNDQLLSATVKEEITPSPDRILSADEAAKYLCLNKKTLQNYVSEGKIQSLRGGKFRRKDLDNFLEHKSKKGKSRT